NVINEYRSLYKNEKAHMAKWTGRGIPFFMK
ncbi:hypothetical protein BRC2024_PQPTKSFJ_CDS_0001, partial [Tegunavirus sp. BRC001]